MNDARALGPALLAASEALWAARVAGACGAQVERDIAYGRDARHRLDLFRPPHGHGPHLPVLLFVPGGGFSGGDKRKPGTPYYDNVGQWAVDHGWAGVTMNYRLAPQHRWPAAAEDVADALAWVVANAADFHLDARRIVLMGHSAGAAHVAGYLAHRACHAPGRSAVRAAVLLSGIYDIAAMGDSASVRSYFGDDIARHGERSSLSGLAEAQLPLFLAVAEDDPDAFHAQAAGLLGYLQSRCGRLPQCMVVPGHNHYTEVFHLGSAGSPLAAPLSAFIDRHVAHHGAVL